MIERADRWPSDRFLWRLVHVYGVPIELLRAARAETFRRWGKEPPSREGQ